MLGVVAAREDTGIIVTIIQAVSIPAICLLYRNLNIFLYPFLFSNINLLNISFVHGY